MCGIAGIFGFAGSAPAADPLELRAIRDHMFKRGPDGAGEWFSQDRRVALAHRRLAIIDLSDRSAQPLTVESGRYAITFNGEIYNYAQLRQQLVDIGVEFKTTSDTEVLLQLYVHRGLDMFRDLRGMFAFAIWDSVKGGLLLARDGYGIKPLYFSVQDGTLRFASQVKALLAGGKVSATRDTAGQVGFYLWGSVPEPFTTFEAISSLPPGSFVWTDSSGASTPKPFFSVASVWSDAAGSAQKPNEGELIRQAMRDSVRAHLVADVPVGGFLSGGIDSGALVGVMSEYSERELHGVTLHFSEFDGRPDDEVPLAAEIAKLYGVEHHVRTVTPNEFSSDLPLILAAMDQPSIDGVNSWFVSKASAELGLKVAISGLGGDELFGGYSSFNDVPKLVEFVRALGGTPARGRLIRKFAAPLLSGIPRIHPKTSGLVEYGSSHGGAYFLKRGLFMPWELKLLLTGDVVEAGLARLGIPERLSDGAEIERATSFGKVAALESMFYMKNQLLRDTDWASMAHSLEVRVPLVDTVLLTQVAPALGRAQLGTGKLALAAAPSKPLPASVQQHPKTGFSTPVQTWLRSAPLLGAWRRVPELRRERCPWARRFAYAVAEHFDING